MILNINVNLSKCNSKLSITDNTDYADMLNNLIFIEFLCYFAYDDNEDTLIPIVDSKKVSYYNSINDYKNYNYFLKYDGRYIYFKYGIYNIESLLDSEEYKIKDKIFYYNNNIYLGIKNITNLEEINSDTSLIISNWYQLKNYVNTNIDYFYSGEIFSFYNLNKCIVNYQKQTINNYFLTKNNICNIDDKYNKSLRNFLFISIYVLDYLVCSKNYIEAQRILENLSTCNHICDDIFINSNKNCNCNYE